MKLFKIIIFICIAIFIGFIVYGAFFEDRIATNYQEPEMKEMRVYYFPEFELYKVANSEREQKLLWNPCLADQAEIRAKQLFETKFIGHIDENNNYPYKTMIPLCTNDDTLAKGENLAWDFYDMDANKMHQDFMNSPTHRDNILNDEYTQTGMGCYEHICVQFFSE